MNKDYEELSDLIAKVTKCPVEGCKSDLIPIEPVVVLRENKELRYDFKICIDCLRSVGKERIIASIYLGDNK